jgi:hypothetical protein
MRFELSNGKHAGTVEWNGPGNVSVMMEDPKQQEWFEDYFSSETTFMTGPVECGEMAHERRDESEAAFTRAAYDLAAYSYKVHQGSARRREVYREGARGA